MFRLSKPFRRAVDETFARNVRVVRHESGLIEGSLPVESG